MILEERITFCTEDVAENFMDWLCDNNCRPEIKKIFNSTLNILVRGTLDDIIDWCGDMAEQDDEYCEDYLEIEEFNELYVDALSLLISGKKPGDLLYTHEDLEFSTIELIARFCDDLELEDKPEFSGYSSKELEAEIFSEIPLSIIHTNFEEEGYVEESEEGYILSTDIKPGEMITETDVTSFELATLENSPKISYVSAFIADEEFEVSFRMPAYLAIDPEELGEVLIDLGHDSDDVADIVHSFRFKRTLLTYMLGIVGKAGEVSVEDLKLSVEKLWREGITGAGSHSKIVISAGVMGSLIDELREEGVLAGDEDMVTASPAWAGTFGKGQ